MEQLIAKQAGNEGEIRIDDRKLKRDHPSRQSLWLVAHADDDIVLLLPGTTIADGAAYAPCPRISNRSLALVAGESRRAMRRRHKQLVLPTQYQIRRGRFDAAMKMNQRAA